MTPLVRGCCYGALFEGIGLAVLAYAWQSPRVLCVSLLLGLWAWNRRASWM